MVAKTIVVIVILGLSMRWVFLSEATKVNSNLKCDQVLEKSCGGCIKELIFMFLN